MRGEKRGRIREDAGLGFGEDERLSVAVAGGGVWRRHGGDRWRNLLNLFRFLFERFGDDGCYCSFDFLDSHGVM